MSELRFEHGDARLLRTESTVVFTHEPNEPLLQFVDSSPSVDFKALAAFVVSQNFDLAPFVVIDTSQNNLFVFRETLRLAGQNLDGTTSNTWIEQKIDPTTTIACGGVSNISGVLGTGWVRAGGFEFGSPHGEVDAEAQSASTALQNAVATDQAVPAIEPVPAPQASEPTSPSEPVAVPIAPAVASTRPEDTTVPLSNGSPDAPDDEWDPLADPGIGLESIGAPEIVADLTEIPVPPTPQPPPAPEPPAVDLDDLREQDTVDLSIPPPPSSVPGVASHADKSDPTLPTPVFVNSGGGLLGQSHNIRFDDGQRVDVLAGLYVGRYPTKNGLPEQYDSVTIRSEQVSRVHWELVLHGETVVVRDLGSNSGTKVDIGSGRVEVPDGGIPIPPGTTVYFGDRSATYELI